MRCTEIPLLISEADSPLPILDSTRILARAALHQAIAPVPKRAAFFSPGKPETREGFRISFSLIVRQLVQQMKDDADAGKIDPEMLA
jgi:hypothetical protein